MALVCDGNKDCIDNDDEEIGCKGRKLAKSASFHNFIELNKI